MDTPKRDVVVTVRLSKDEFDRLQKYSKKYKISTSKTLRTALNKFLTDKNVIQN